MVSAPKSEKLIVCATLGNLALVQHDDLVRGGDCGEAMATDNVTYPLAFTSRQLQPPLSDLGLVAIREIQYTLMDIGSLARLVHVFFRRIRSGVEQVVHDGSVEQNRILGHHTDISTEAVELEIPKVVAVNSDGAVRDVVEAEEEFERGRFAAAGFSNNGSLGSRGNSKVDSIENRATLLRVGEDGALREIERGQRPLYQALSTLEDSNMLPKPPSLTRNSAVVLNRFVRDDGIRLDSLHLTSLDCHVSALLAAVLGHIDGKEDVRPHDEEDNDGVESVILDEEDDTSDEDIKHHREDLEAEALKEGVD
ncbi:hypothetical protein HG530_010486 [Fusarium avenaceum]|nr:hypothetical protein HG530_010486 [Fusarium avenaceum]